MMKTDLCKLLNIDIPVFAFSHCRDVVVEVSKAGGFGVLGIAGFSLEQLEAELQWIDERIGDKHYGVDLLIPQTRVEECDLDKLQGMIPQKQRDFVDSLLEQTNTPELPADHQGHFASADQMGIIGDRPYEMLAQSLKHKKITLYVNALGIPPERVMKMCCEAGVKTAAMAGKVKHAVQHKEAGVDMVISVGSEAAGHTGDISTMVLTPQVVDAVAPLPVLAAGGIASGRQVAAALALGAEGVWTGSVWLPTSESELSQIQREKIVRCASEDTLRSRCLTGKPVRMMRSAFTDAWGAPGAPEALAFPLQPLLTQEAMNRFEKFDVEEMVTYPAGQVIGALKQEQSVRQVVQGMMEEYLASTERLSETLDY